MLVSNKSNKIKRRVFMEPSGQKHAYFNAMVDFNNKPNILNLLSLESVIPDEREMEFNKAEDKENYLRMVNKTIIKLKLFSGQVCDDEKYNSKPTVLNLLIGRIDYQIELEDKFIELHEKKVSTKPKKELSEEHKKVRTKTKKASKNSIPTLKQKISQALPGKLIDSVVVRGGRTHIIVRTNSGYLVQRKKDWNEGKISGIYISDNGDLTFDLKVDKTVDNIHVLARHLPKMATNERKTINVDDDIYYVIRKGTKGIIVQKEVDCERCLESGLFIGDGEYGGSRGGDIFFDRDNNCLKALAIELGFVSIFKSAELIIDTAQKEWNKNIIANRHDKNKILLGKLARNDKVTDQQLANFLEANKIKATGFNFDNDSVTETLGNLEIFSIQPSPVTVRIRNRGYATVEAFYEKFKLTDPISIIATAQEKWNKNEVKNNFDSTKLYDTYKTLIGKLAHDKVTDQQLADFIKANKIRKEGSCFRSNFIFKDVINSRGIKGVETLCEESPATIGIKKRGYVDVEAFYNKFKL